MSEAPREPAFGEADLSNCDRELIQFPGSIQPHGVLLVIDAARFVILQASANADEMLGVTAESLLLQSTNVLGGDLSAQLRWRLATGVSALPKPLRCHTEKDGQRRGFEVLIHRNRADAVLLEMEPVDLDKSAALAKELPPRLADSVDRIGAAATLDALANTAVNIYREIAGYDRVMFYRFDPDGHGEVIAEAKEPYLEPFLGLHYPATDIPPRARELYLRNRVRVLVDVNY